MTIIIYIFFIIKLILYIARINLSFNLMHTATIWLL